MHGHSTRKQPDVAVTNKLCPQEFASPRCHFDTAAAAAAAAATPFRNLGACMEARSGSRAYDRTLTKRMLYQLRYRGPWGQDNMQTLGSTADMTRNYVWRPGPATWKAIFQTRPGRDGGHMHCGDVKRQTESEGIRAPEGRASCTFNPSLQPLGHAVHLIQGMAEWRQMFGTACLTGVRASSSLRISLP